jgi:UDP-2-acetamido-3-amino-2,3-dideoxy-glucuronate N-acetyltransferase
VSRDPSVFVHELALCQSDQIGPRPRAGSGRGREVWLPTPVRQGATIGANATVVCGVTVGRFALVGPAAWSSPTSPTTLVVGRPARQVGWACACGQTLPDDLNCASGRSYELAGSRLVSGA